MSLSPRTNPLPYLLSGLCCFRQSHFWFVFIDPQFASFVALSGCTGGAWSWLGVGRAVGEGSWICWRRGGRRLLVLLFWVASLIVRQTLEVNA